MKKRIFALLMALCCSFLFFACGDSEEEQTGDVMLRIWTVGGPLHYMHNDPNDKDSNTTNYILETFQELYPNVNIILENGGWAADLNKSLRDAYIANKMPDIVCGELFIKSQIELNYYEALTIPEEIKSNIDQVFWDQVSDEEGNIYGYPVYTGCSALVYNETLVRNAGLVNADGSVRIPQTMDELMDFASQVYSRSNHEIGGFLMNAVPGVGSAYRNVTIMQMFGGGFYDDEGNLIINSEESKAAMQWLQDISAYQYSGNTAITEEAQINKLFLDNKVAFAIESGPLTYASSDIKTDHLKVAALPAVSGQPSTNLLVGSVSYMISKSCKNKEVAQAFLEHLVSPEVQEMIYLQSSNRVPVRRDVISDLLLSEEEEVIARNEVMRPYIESLFSAEHLVAGLPSFGNNYSKIWNSWTTTIQNILGRNGDVDQYLDDFAQTVLENT